MQESNHVTHSSSSVLSAGNSEIKLVSLSAWRVTGPEGQRWIVLAGDLLMSGGDRSSS